MEFQLRTALDDSKVHYQHSNETPIHGDTNSTVFVLHYWTLSTGPCTDGPSGRTAPGVDRQLLKVTDSS
jgi:hypothetical protein